MGLDRETTPFAQSRRLWAQELCNNRDLRRVHEGRRMTDFRKFEQLRALKGLQ
jgi:hypothetical protein